MRTLTIEETNATSGAIAPALYGAFMAYNYIRIAYTGTQIAGAAGWASGLGISAYAVIN